MTGNLTPFAHPIRACLYLRISNDPDGEREGVDRQEEDGRKLAANRGAEIVRVYMDNDIGASDLSKKPRIDYPRMLADAEAGEFDVIIAYSNSRITRRPRELEDLIQLHERTGGRVRIWTCVSGDDDLSTADGQMVARFEAFDDHGRRPPGIRAPAPASAGTGSRRRPGCGPRQRARSGATAAQSRGAGEFRRCAKRCSTRATPG